MAKVANTNWLSSNPLTAISYPLIPSEGFPGGLRGKESTYRCRRRRINPWVGKIPGEVNSNLIQYSCLGNCMDRGAWWAAVQGVAKSWTWPSDKQQQHPLSWITIPHLRATWVSAIQHFSDVGESIRSCITWHECLSWGLELNHVNIPAAQCVDRDRKKVASSHQVRFDCQKCFCQTWMEENPKSTFSGWISELKGWIYSQLHFPGQEPGEDEMCLVLWH